jgi:predicted nucleic acid-binding protein
MTRIIDASVLVAALVDSGTDGEWAEAELLGDQLAAPHLLAVEIANILRRAVLAGDISGDTGALAHAELLELRIELFPYESVAARVWDLRHNLTVYDACYVALAEQLDAPLATLDERLARSPGPRCTFVTPRG